MKPKWICCQIGAREHYAVPRALQKNGQLNCLITDYWSDGGLTSKLTNRAARRLASRTHRMIPNDLVHHFNTAFVKLEVENRLSKRRGWEAIVHRNRWFQSAAAKKVEATIRTTGADVLFSYSYGAKQIFEEAKPLGTKLILGQIDPGPFEWKFVNEIHSRHGIAPLEMPPEKYWENWRAECDLADIIIANSNWSKDALIGQEIPESKIQVIPLAYQAPDDVSHQTSDLPNTFSNERKLQVLFLGQVIARKGVLELAVAIKSLRNQPVEFTVVGGGDESTLARLRKLENVNVTGQVDRREAVEFYKKSDVFILPTHSDGFAITLLEAAAFGLPIIASPFCGDVVRHDIDGITLKEVSPEAIEDAIVKLLFDIPAIKRFQQNQSNRQFRTISDLANELASLTT